MPRLSAEELAKREAAAEALSAPTISPTEQAIVDAMAHEAKKLEAEKLMAETAPSLKLPPGWVRARILRRGHGKIYTGQINGTKHAEDKFTTFNFGDVVALPPDVAVAQEKNDNVEVLPEYRKALGLLEL